MSTPFCSQGLKTHASALRRDSMLTVSGAFCWCYVVACLRGLLFLFGAYQTSCVEIHGGVATRRILNDIPLFGLQISFCCSYITSNTSFIARPCALLVLMKFDM